MVVVELCLDVVGLACALALAVTFACERRNPEARQ
jgi:hypothetical protein